MGRKKSEGREGKVCNARTDSLFLHTRLFHSKTRRDDIEFLYPTQTCTILLLKRTNTANLHHTVYIGGKKIWRIAQKRKKIAIGGYKFGGYGTIATPSPGVGAILADLILAV